MTAGEPLVQLCDVWRKYRRGTASRRSTLRGTLASGARAFRQEWFWALRGVDLAVRRGRVVAVVGRNGAGKSMLLRLTGGVGRPDHGSVTVNGRVGALLDLGREFHPDLTGRQNAELAAVIAGLTRAEFRHRFDEVIDFAGLADFVDEPLRAYSDGMRARLAFSVITRIDPDVLLVDEVLAVGDAAFQRRSIDRIEALRHNGVGIMFVSHDLSLVRRLCDDAVWLDAGRVLATGDATTVVNEYLENTATPTEPTVRAPGRGVGLEGVRVLDAWDALATSIRCGDGLVVAARATAEGIDDPVQVSVKLRRAGTRMPSVDTSTTMSEPRADVRVRFERLDITPGSYDVTIALFDVTWETCLAEHRTVLDVRGDGPDAAPLAPPHEWTRS